VVRSRRMSGALPERWEAFMNVVVLPRQRQSKSVRKHRRRQGFIPAVIFGRNVQPLLVETPARAISEVLLSDAGLNSVIDVSVDGDSGTHQAVMCDLVRDPITRDYVAVGLHQIEKGEKITAHVPVRLIGEPGPVADGAAILEQMAESITVHALPGDVPAHLDVDVSGMGFGDVIRISDLPHNAKLDFVEAETSPLAAVHVVKAASVETPEAEEKAEPAAQTDREREEVGTESSRSETGQAGTNRD
jgi:large subunit ribosomal protein L25